MKTTALLASFILLALTASPVLAPEDAVLERYSFGVGQNSDGVITVHDDQFFGGGTARANVVYFGRNRTLDPTAESGVFVLHVSRFVRPDEITFALLVFGIEVRGYDAAGTEVFSQDLDGFTFGDSSSGRYTKTLRNLPLSIAKLDVTFRGNYE